MVSSHLHTHQYHTPTTNPSGGHSNLRTCIQSSTSYDIMPPLTGVVTSQAGVTYAMELQVGRFTLGHHSTDDSPVVGHVQ